VLTIDCRDGWVSEEAWRRLGRGYVCGIDTSPAMSRVADELRGVPGQVEFKTWDGERLPLADASFNLAIWVYGFHRRRKPLEVLREVRRVLRPGAHFYLLEANRAGFGGLYGLWDYVNRLVDEGHVRYYTARQLSVLMERAGFPKPAEIRRHQRVLTGGKLFSAAVTLRGQRASE
jgi:ubiquinone/menaquinone biosynthesis C-methylase UbiE